MKKKLSVAFLWHMHQPMYKDLITGRYHLPWVRLHSTYSYFDMASILEEFPDAKVTFNFTPSLLWQLLDIAKEEESEDVYLELSKRPAPDLTDRDKCFILKNFFSCDLKRAILPIKKYGDLFYRRGNDLREEELNKKINDFSEGDWRDLQTFFNLAWCGFTLKERDALVKSLLHKGLGYTENEKLALLKRQKEVVASIIPLYKKLQDEGKIEISTSAFYHPILPLLCREKRGKTDLFCHDAKVQVERAVAFYEEIFGQKPSGMWPPEGSVSQEIIPLLSDAGIKWMATDEGILLESLKRSDLAREDLIYNTFTAFGENSKIDIIFRDVNISNAISFRYANIPSEKAVGELLHDLEGIRKATETKKGCHVAAIILDGENPWPYYPGGGKDFLRGIYREISSKENLELVTVDGYLKSHDQRSRIDKLFAGSWIDRSFAKWIGSPQKNRAWEYLVEAREVFKASGSSDKRALEELYIAEGSDWFWWYDDFGSELNFVFDRLFRLHLTNLYSLIKKEIPGYLLKALAESSTVQTLSGGADRGEMARALKVLIVSSEAVPFAKTGGLADVAGSLPKALSSFGLDIRVIMPYYRGAKKIGQKFIKEAGGIKNPLIKDVFGFDVYSTHESGTIFYFVKKRKYFARNNLYGTAKGDYPDNALRFGFFSKAVLAAIKAVDFKPDIIHCNDWQSGLVPFYMRHILSDDEFYKKIKTLFTIHNIAYQGIFDKSVMNKIGIPEGFFNMHDLEFYGKLNLMKSGILYSDALSTVSHKYAEEILTEEYGSGLDGLLRTRRDALYGIPNGADYSVWSPDRDPFIEAHYSINVLDGKTECKKKLLSETRLKVSMDSPLIGSITRLAEQKGMDLLAGIMDKLVNRLGAGLVILGKGNAYYNGLFKSLAAKYPKNVFVCNDFNNKLAHRIEAGCDMFVMPSRYEPCGLNQIYSIRYGTIPIVRATGGLDDAISDFDEERENANGFKFGPATEEAFYGAIERAVRLYKTDKKAWHKLMTRAMQYDFSWENSAKEYVKLYKKICS